MSAEVLDPNEIIRLSQTILKFRRMRQPSRPTAADLPHECPKCGAKRIRPYPAAGVAGMILGGAVAAIGIAWANEGKFPVSKFSAIAWAMFTGHALGEEADRQFVRLHRCCACGNRFRD